MITLTANAAAKVKGILEQEKESLPQGGLRIYVQGGGCSGFQYGMVLDEVAEGDQVLELEGVKVIVDPMSLRHLEGAEVDYKEDLMGGGFAIKNPNAKSTCGCGHSFQAAGRGRGRPAALSGLVPLFPLPNVVLFPGAPLPLHVFEPRYRKMVADALASHRTIGMVLLKPGLRGGLPGAAADLPARLLRGRSSRTSGSRTGATTSCSSGSPASACSTEHDGEPYRLAAVEELPDPAGDAASLDALRERLLAALSG